MERRHFLHVSAVAACGMGLSGAAWLSVEPSPVLTRPELLDVLGSRTVADLGRAYRVAFRSESSEDALKEAILESTGRSSKLPPIELQERLSKQTRDEFANGRTVRINGWVLSVTEARQCALHSFTA